MGKLHELLAVEGDLKGVHDKIIKESVKTFGRNELFLGHSKRLEMRDDDRKHEEAAGAEEKKLTTTAMERLDYTADAVMRYYDALLQKELTNQEARCDLVVNGVEIGKDLPATFLLGLETRLKLLRGVYESTPTLQAGVHWDTNPDDAPNVHRTKFEEISNKTEKVMVPQILYEATKEHPAQVEKLTKDVVVGSFIKTVWSGMLTSRQKYEMLTRLDALIREVKKARMRANEQEVKTEEIGKKIFDFIHNGSS